MRDCCRRHVFPRIPWSLMPFMRGRIGISVSCWCPRMKIILNIIPLNPIIFIYLHQKRPFLLAHPWCKKWRAWFDHVGSFENSAISCEWFGDQAPVALCVAKPTCWCRFLTAASKISQPGMVGDTGDRNSMGAERDNFTGPYLKVETPFFFPLSWGPTVVIHLMIFMTGVFGDALWPTLSRDGSWNHQH